MYHATPKLYNINCFYEQDSQVVQCAKGFGFIHRENGPDVFVHHSAIQGGGYRELAEGEQVEFEVMQSPKGLQSSGVTRSGG